MAKARVIDLSTVQGRARARKYGIDVPYLKVVKWDGPPTPNKTCIQCSKSYHTYEKQRLYCSYACHLASGGAMRAGLASKRAAMKYGAKKDANHKEIVEVLERLGVPIMDLSMIGGGVPDCLAQVNGRLHFVEIKNKKTAYGRRGMNKNQIEWAERWPNGIVYLIHSIEEAIEFANGRMGGIKQVKCGEKFVS